MSKRANTEEKDVCNTATYNDFIDYKRLKDEIKRLNSVKKKVLSDIDKENLTLSDLIEKGIETKKELDKMISEAKKQAKEIIDKAKEKQDEEVELEAKLQIKISNAEEDRKISADLIKSNTVKEKNLGEEKDSVNCLQKKLAKVIDLIKDVI